MDGSFDVVCRDRQAVAGEAAVRCAGPPCCRKTQAEAKRLVAKHDPSSQNAVVVVAVVAVAAAVAVAVALDEVAAHCSSSAAPMNLRAVLWERWAHLNAFELPNESMTCWHHLATSSWWDHYLAADTAMETGRCNA